MYYVLTLYYHHDSRNKLKHKVTIYRHYKNAHTPMRKSSRGEEESRKEMRRDREPNKKDRDKRKEKERKKEEEISMNNLKINKTEVKI